MKETNSIFQKLLKFINNLFVYITKWYLNKGKKGYFSQ